MMNLSSKILSPLSIIIKNINMKKLSFVLTVILLTTFSSCKKTENRTNNTVTYELDSIRIQIVNEITNDSTYAGTVILRQSAQDSFFNILPIIQNGDSLKLLYFGFDPWGTPELGEFAILLNSKYWNNKWKTTDRKSVV